jgi:tape measure domain-containing protein
MSLDIATLGIKVDAADVRNASAELKVLIEVGVTAEQTTERLKESFGGLETVLAGLGLAELTKKAYELTTSFTNMEGQLSLVTHSTTELTTATNSLFEIAQKTRTSYEVTGELYAKIARATKELGVNQTDLLNVTKTLSEAVTVSHVPMQQAEAGLTQLGQAFGAGRLQGQDLKALLEDLPRVGQAVADGLGITTGKLREMGTEGKLTSEVVFNALAKSTSSVEAEFDKLSVTLPQSFTQFNNALMKYVGEANQGAGITSEIAVGVSFLAKNIDVIVPSVVALSVALGVGFVTSTVAARLAAAEATTTIGSLGVVAKGAGASILSAFGGPVGLAITGVTIAIGGMIAENVRANEVISTVNKSYDEMNKRLNDAKTAAEGAASGSHGVGTSATAAIPGVESLTGKVKGLANEFYNTADAAKKARIEMAATALSEARKNETAAAALTPQARNSSGAGFVRGDILKNAGILWSAVSGGGRSLLSGGRTDREAEDAYAKAVQVSIQARKDLEAAYSSSNGGIARGTQVNAEQIEKLKGQISDLKKLREEATPQERKRISAQIANKERKVTLLGTGASEDAVNETVGGAGNGNPKRTAKTEEERQYDSAVKSSERYITQLQKETEVIGLNEYQTKLVQAAREAAKAPNEALRKQILEEADAWVSATLSQETNERARKSLTEMIDKERKASEDAQKAGKELLDQIDFENRLRPMNNEQRATATATRDLETKGIKEGTIAWALYGQAIYDAAASKGALQDQADAAGLVADKFKTVSDSVKGATDSFGQLFGTAGQGFATLIQSVTDYAEQSVDAERTIAEARARYGEDSIEARNAQAKASEQMANKELATYGSIIGAAKNMFAEKSAGYKVMEAAEKAYSVIRLALAVKEIVTEGLKTTTHVAGAGVRMATDATETASSVTHSGIRAAADGVAAFAKTLASLPFPFNIAAGAAVIAALVGVGVAITGGFSGGSNSASASAETDAANDNAAGSFAGLGRSSGSNYNVTSSAKPSSSSNFQSGSVAGQAPAALLKSSLTSNMKLVIENAPAGTYFEPKSMSDEEMRVTMRQIAREESPKAIAGELAQPNSQTAMALKNSFEVTPRR